MAPYVLDSSSNGSAPRGSSSSRERNGDAVEAIAIVGMATGFPQDIRSPEALWRAMLQKRSTATDFPKSRMNVDAIYHPDTARRGQISVKRGHFLEQDIAAFDAPFFSTSTTDASSMDPQQRLLLEYTYLALENAGMPMEKVAGSKTSVYTGSFSVDWQHLVFRDGETCGTTTATGATSGLNANRISWFFDFIGNSANVDTACSSSLVCLDWGCQGLRSGTEDMSIVAGSNVMLSPDNMHSLTNLNMLSADGECYSFDHRGNGYSRGEGVAVLVLKRVSDALRDGDTIRAIIRNSGCNQDGRTPSVTLPNPISQAKLIRRCYAQAKLSMDPVRFFEAHGTGTAVGDPTEASGFGSVFRHVRSIEDPLWIGAVKSNIGHLEGASGIAGVVKALLVLEKGVIPPNNNFQKLNSKIDADFLRIKFPTEATPWPVTGLRRASVNSFGNGGTNAHVVLDDVYHFLEERGLVGNHLTVRDPPTKSSLRQISNPAGTILLNPDNPQENPLLEPRLLVFSAADEAGIARQTKSFASYFSKIALAPEQQQRYIDDVAYTLAHRRSRLSWRSFAVVRSMHDLVNLDRLTSSGRTTVSAPGVGFIFTGQGAQWAGMGRELMVFPAFKHTLHRLEKHLTIIGCPWMLRDELLQKDAARINRPEFAQPLCTAVQIALVNLLSSHGLLPTAVVGHSSGEIAAAYCVGALSDTSAMEAAYFRGKLASELAQDQSVKGAMMSVSLSESDVTPYISKTAAVCGEEPGLVVACINSPTNVTVSGDESQIDALRSILEGEGIFNRKLAVDVAYHSPHMQAIAEKYREMISPLRPGVPPQKATIMFSSVTGEQAVSADLSTPDYWVQNMVSPVKFVSAVSALCSQRAQRAAKKLDLSHRRYVPVNMLMEIGPHSALQRPAKDIMANLPRMDDIAYASCLIRNNDAETSFFSALGQVHCLGYDVRLERDELVSSKAHGVTLTDLPGYRFDHSKQYWEESRISAQYRNQQQTRLDLLGKPVTDWNPLEPRWRNHLRPSEMSWIEDHVINGSTIYPGAGMMVMAIEGTYQIADKSQVVEGIEIRDVSFVRSLPISQGEIGTETQLSLRVQEGSVKTDNPWFEFRIFAYDQASWHECCRGLSRPRYKEDSNAIGGLDEEHQRLLKCRNRLSAFESLCTAPLEPTTLYDSLVRNGLGLGPTFHRVQRGAFDGESRVIAELKPYTWPESEYPQEHIVHPTTLDAIFHVAMAGYAEGGTRNVGTMIPTHLGRLFVRRNGLGSSHRGEIRECAWLKQEDARSTTFGAFALDHDNTTLLAEFDDLQLTKIAQAQPDTSMEASSLGQSAFNVEYLADVDHMSGPEIEKYCTEDSTPSLLRWIDLMSHKNLGLNILEIADAGQRLNVDLLRHLSVFDQASQVAFSRYGSYCFMSNDSEFLKEVKDRSVVFPFVRFEHIDITKAADVKTFAGEFDVILAPESCGRQKSTADNLRQLLADKGKLALVQPTIYDEKSAPLNPAADSLNTSGFSDTYLSLSFQGQRVTVHDVSYAKPDESTSQSVPPSVVIVHDSASTAQQHFCQSVSAILGSAAYDVATASLEEAVQAINTDCVYIIALELQSPFLYTLSEKDYGLLQTFLLSASDIVWVTYRGGSASESPEFSIINGLSRVMHREREDLRMTTLALHVKDVPATSQLQRLIPIVRDHLHRTVHRESEYIEVDGILTVPRIFPSIEATEDIRTRSLVQSVRTDLLKDAPPVALSIGSVGLLDSLHFAEDHGTQAELAPDEIDVQSKAIGLSYLDCQVALGQSSSAALGQECAGVVVCAGSEALFAPGDRVMLAAPGTFKTVARSKAQHATKIPDDMAFSTAAAIPTAFGIAWETIAQLGRLQKGESILIHAAAGGIGQAAIQVAQHLGAIIYATVGSQSKKETLVKEYGIPEDHIFYSRDATFVEGVKRMTGERGVDVILNSLVGQLMLASWDCVAPYGRFVNISKKDIAANASLAMSNFGKNASFVGFDWSLFCESRPLAAQATLRSCLENFTAGNFRVPQPFHLADISEVKSAFESLSEGTLAGKFVLEIKDESRVEMSPDATYVIAGGLGGIGRATARWMVERGARNLILLSRSGPRAQVAFDLIQELQVLGARVETPACDVTDLKRMKEVFGSLAAEMPPIKGCMQASIVARDCLFDRLPYEDWHVAVTCKTIGSWNLHTVLPSGNTYEDALARYRVGQGEKAVSFDLGAMLEDGILAETPELLNRVLGYGTLQPIDRRTYYALLDYYCNPALPLLTPRESQVAFGLGVGGGEGLEGFDFSTQRMMHALQLLGEKQDAAGSGGTGQVQTNYRKLFAAASSLDEASDIVVDAVVGKLGKSLAVMQDRESIDLHRPLQVYGVDSLLAVELRNWVAKEFTADIAVFETQGASTLGTLSFLVARRSTIKHEGWAVSSE